MKQIIQSFKTGKTVLEEIPRPMIRKGTVLIRTTKSLVSPGTERMLVEFGKSNLISKALQQPEKVGMVLDKMKSDGLIPTLEAVFNKLEQPIPLGYCNVGRVVEIGEGVKGFSVGDRVASNGPHAEFVCVPENLAVHIPDEVGDDEACFTVIGSIALQSIRLLNPALGETVVVIGLGLIGLITAQLLRANGCKVIGLDIDQERLNMAAQWGVIPFNTVEGEGVKFVQGLTQDTGADGVIITASAKTDDLISQAARMSRKRGKIILVGVVGLNINRAEFYEKELSFQVSCSYGPGRYDEEYEQQGKDYPIAYVRWTEKRNFEAVMQCMVSGQLKLKELITEVVPLHLFSNIYSNIGHRSSIASILQYEDASVSDAPCVSVSSGKFQPGKGVIGILGAGNYTRMTMLPALKKSGAAIKYIVSAGGINAVALARKYRIANAATDYSQVINDPEVDIILITTRHDLHTQMILDSLAGGKHVFVEKPLTIFEADIPRIEEAYRLAGKILVVGFNRRFSAHATKLKAALGPGIMNVVVTCNAGYIPEQSWVHQMNIGGGRIIGEACHFMDLISFFTDSRIKAVCMNAMEKFPEENTDNASILLKYENGSTGVIHYFSNGSKKYQKERVEVYSQARTGIIENWQITRGYGFKDFNRFRSTMDKGHLNQFTELIKAVQSGDTSLIPFASILNTTKASFAAIQSLKTGGWVHLV